MPLLGRSIVRFAIIGVTAALAVAQFSSSQAQHAPEHGQHSSPASSPSIPPGPFSVRSYGAFGDMAQRQDYQPKVTLGEAKAGGATDAVGALSGLRGEVTMLDGRLFVSYGEDCAACPPPHEEKATLLATGKVAEWGESVVLPENLAGKSLEAFIVDRAKAAGLDPSKPFPVRLKGTLLDVTMHVLKSPEDKRAGHGHGHGSSHPMAKMTMIDAKEVAGEVIGFYSPPALSGILTHPGEPFHLHWVDEQRTRTAHLDNFGMAKGSHLSFPKR